MRLNNYQGICTFRVLANTGRYILQETSTQQEFIAPLEDLINEKTARRDSVTGVILRNETLDLFCRWDGRMWRFSPLRLDQMKAKTNNFVLPSNLEDGRTELKESGILSLEADVAAFANADGGTIYWGISDTGNIVGIEWLIEKYSNQDKLSSMLRNRLKQNLNSLLFAKVDFSYIKTGGHIILKITVPASAQVVLFKDQLHIRSGNTNQRLYGDQFLSFVLQKYQTQNR